jgi:malonyl-CoA O-methyltransferase
MNKEKISSNFAKATDQYDKFAHMQRQIGDYLIKKLQEESDIDLSNINTVLDLGSGTGYMLEKLSNFLPKKTFYHINDIAPEMLAFTKQKFNHLQTESLCGDFDFLDCKFYDLIISNLAFQWSGSIYKAIKKYYNHANNIFVFSCLLEGSFLNWGKILKQYCLEDFLIPYPEFDKLKNFVNLLPSKKIFFEIKEFTCSFENAKSFLYYLKGLGAISGQKKLPFAKLKNIIKKENQRFAINYKVFFVVVKK